MATLLKPSDLRSETWTRLRVILLERIEQHRTELEAESPDERTATLRGRLRALRDLLALEKAPAKRARPAAELGMPGGDEDDET